ncbi:superoxide dismutase [Hutsoniella sourekii]|uniref:superoxide dismutase n=1 Tax=Hutsoniella sourekii TaxID=87650 RepID=UPI000487B2F1|nr:superoxide dismutase [Hutsoniella sourekii]
MAFELPNLPYAHDALEPVIDKETMELHHGKHHNTYVTNLNKAVEGTEWADKSIEEVVSQIDQVPEDIRTAVRNNGGGHINHTLFWEEMKSPVENNEIPEAVASKLEAAFGSVDSFKEKFEAAATGQFGSGWAWLVESDGELEVIGLPNQDNPLMVGKNPILGIDVWEHAYYLNYRNVRADYVKAFWQVINWDVVAERLGA